MSQDGMSRADDRSFNPDDAVNASAGKNNAHTCSYLYIRGEYESVIATHSYHHSSAHMIHRDSFYTAWIFCFLQSNT